ncbi:zinc-binding dehydrogenase [Rhodococcus sp. ABRD24]|uniref:zinc-binding dehydrogenase n=1 Tax=Rhodococcus sp. ABRD24 TaxID=2507582 RepID=UPI00103D1CA9|nr:zinc-binding dehydrogenase [Rhodococcus sp. ABRD24]QBJ96563.1 zinc-binding dehydrogenase [Rhodococcus sp. ABRD24]
MTQTMRAQRLYAETRTVTVEDVPIPTPGEGEVLVKIAYCGICHSDISQIDGTFTPKLPILTLGHEASGYIAEVGPDVTGWAVGDPVIIAAGRPCTTCRNCLRGQITACQNLRLMASAYDGGWAEYAVAEARGLTRVPDNVPMEQAAILADAVSTPYGAVVRTGKVSIGESVGVWGAGGVGTHIIQLSKLVGAVPILAFDIEPKVRERALDLGADYAFDPTADDLVERVAEATNGRMLDVAFDAVGTSSTFDQALASVDAGGRVVLVGMTGQELSLGPSTAMARSSKQVLGHLGYHPSDIGVLAALVSHGRLDLSRSISEIISLENVADGITKLQTREGNPIRILVKP